MRLDVKNELPAQALLPRQTQFRLARLGFVDLEYVAAIDLIHSQEGRGHSTAGAHKLTAAEAQAFAVDVGQFEDSLLKSFLDFALRRRKIFTVRHDLGRDRRRRGSRFST